jgi:hypothetical protein
MAAERSKLLDVLCYTYNNINLFLFRFHSVHGTRRFMVHTTLGLITMGLSKQYSDRSINQRK